MLSLIAKLYGGIVALRNRLYERGVFETHDLGARTISIGNITTGGTGKTPLVAYVARLLAERGEKVCILTRGYGRADETERVLVSDGKTVLVDAAEGGDEPVELAQKLLGKAIVIADADRVGAAEWALRKFGTTAFVLDDGFQHRKVKRDVDIVCIDATDALGGGAVLPAGSLRESLGSLGRASVVVITRTELVDRSTVSDIRSEISKAAPDVLTVEARTAFNGLQAIGPDPATAPRDEDRMFAFCGLGNPTAFFSMLRREGIELTGDRAFRDHYAYTQGDVDDLVGSARTVGAYSLVTTAKDAAKLTSFHFEMPCFFAEIDVEIEPRAEFAAMI